MGLLKRLLSKSRRKNRALSKRVARVKRNIVRMVDEDIYTAWRDGDRTETHTGKEWKKILEDESQKA